MHIAREGGKLKSATTLASEGLSTNAGQNTPWYKEAETDGGRKVEQNRRDAE